METFGGKKTLEFGATVEDHVVDSDEEADHTYNDDSKYRA